MSRPPLKKQQIEDAAIHLFATKGLTGTTIRDIALKAGVTDGALYRHYASKNEMAQQLFYRELETFCTPLDAELFAPDRHAAERLERSVRFIHEYYREHPVRFAFILLTQHGFPEDPFIPEFLNPFSMAARFIGEAVESGELPPQDPLLSAAMLMGIVLQPMVLHQYKRLDLTPARVDDAAKGALRLLGLNSPL